MNVYAKKRVSFSYIQNKKKKPSLKYKEKYIHNYLIQLMDLSLSEKDKSYLRLRSDEDSCMHVKKYIKIMKNWNI